MIEWQFPWAFLALALIPLIWFVPARQPRGALWVANAQLEQGKADKHWLARLLFMLALAALIIAFARPEKVGEPIEVIDSRRDMSLVVDLSGSMERRDVLAGDTVLPRITAVKLVLADFIERRSGDRMGLVFFADHAYVQAPITRDLQTLRGWLADAKPGMIGNSTAIGEGIVAGVRQVKDLEAQEKVMILLSDGRNTSGEIGPIEAAQWAADQGVTIYAVGLDGATGQADGRTLTQVAQLTGGRYFNARNGYDLVQVYQAIDQLEPIDREADPIRINEPLYYWPLLIAVTLLMSLLIWRGRFA